MATYLMFGTSTQAARDAVSAKRTEDALALIKKHGGELKAGYATLGEVDFVIVVDLPDTERAIQVSLGLSRLLDGPRPRSVSTSSTSSRRPEPSD
jgi:uncharacterized protein with GYD domain